MQFRLPRYVLFLSAILSLVLLGVLACGGSGSSSSSMSTSGGSGSGSGGSGSGSGGMGGTGGSGGSGSGSGSGSGGGSSSPGTAIQVLTYHNDNSRSGQTTVETTLTTANVNAASFGKIGFDAADGHVDAEPLYVPSLSIGGATHNVLYVVTENDSAYAFDADTGATLWKVSVLGANETPSDPRNCGQVAPQIGITSTPVIDPTAGAHGVMYLVAASKDNSGKYHQRFHALDIATGAEISGSPVTVQATYPGSGAGSAGGQVVFDPSQYNERAGLLLLNGAVYIGWSSHCDIQPYTGWLMGYNEATLAQITVLNLTPNGSEGSIWQSGDGLAADANGNIFFLDANGTFDTTLNASGQPVNGDYGNGFMKVSTAGNKLAVADYFEMSNTVSESNADEDLGSGGTVLLPDETDASGTVRHLAVGAGKDRNIYLVDRDNMGKFNANTNNLYQELPGALAGQEFGTPAYWNNTVYYGSVGDVLRAYPVTQAKLATGPASQSSHTFTYPGTTPSISSSGTTNGIVWAVDNSTPAGLYAYDATNLGKELYDSNQAANGRDQFGPGNKFITPMIANGKVYVGTQTGVAVFGLLK